MSLLYKNNRNYSDVIKIANDDSEYKKDQYVNIGCGCKKLDMFDNYDKFPVDDSVKFLDCEVTPWNVFSDNSLKYICMHNVFEHLKVSCRMDVVKEIYKKLMKGCIFDVELPLLMPRINHQSWFHHRGYFNPYIWFKSRGYECNRMGNENEGVYFDVDSFNRYLYGFKYDFPFIIILQRWKLKKR